MLCYACLDAAIPLLLLDHRWSGRARHRLCASIGPCDLLPANLDGFPSPDLAVARVPDPTRMRMLDAGRSAAEHGVRLALPTSGSSGATKLVMLTASNLEASVRAAGSRIPLRPGDRWLNCLPLHHIGGLAILLRCLDAGAGVTLHPRFNVDAVRRELGRGGITHLSVVPAMLHALLENGPDAVPEGLRAVLVGGAALDPGLAARARRRGWPLWVSYGMTETGSQIATVEGGYAEAIPGLVGRPLPGFRLRIRHPDPDGVGVIQVRGAALMAGYVATGLYPGGGLRDGWFDTGDLGRLHSDGELQVLGRADDMLSSGGEKVHPAQVEPVLKGCPGVRDAALSAVPDPKWGDRLVAVYQGGIAPTDLEAYCRGRLRGALRPRGFVRVDRMPLTAGGKTDRAELRRLLLRMRFE
jgi:O-succinylbenzoic acid--CoA ligase